tara:strand:- start:1103 stop:1678 length:576 start_codon:yes stop_codon:yes gene_type:complete
MNKNILPSGRKATRYEYELKIVNFLNNNKKNLGEHCLEISGDTHIFTNYFKKKTIAYFPEVDAHNLPYKDNTYDCVIFNQVLEHVKKPWVCVNEAHRVLKKGGIIILISPFIYQFHEYPNDYWRFTEEGMGILVEKFEKILLKGRSGNVKLLQHMIKYPNDRRSVEMKKLQLLDKKYQEKYFVNSHIIAQK